MALVSAKTVLLKSLILGNNCHGKISGHSESEILNWKLYFLCVFSSDWVQSKLVWVLSSVKACVSSACIEKDKVVLEWERIKYHSLGFFFVWPNFTLDMWERICACVCISMRMGTCERESFDLIADINRDCRVMSSFWFSYDRNRYYVNIQTAMNGIQKAMNVWFVQKKVNYPWCQVVFFASLRGFWGKVWWLSPHLCLFDSPEKCDSCVMISVRRASWLGVRL